MSEFTWQKCHTQNKEKQDHWFPQQHRINCIAWLQITREQWINLKSLNRMWINSTIIPTWNIIITTHKILVQHRTSAKMQTSNTSKNSLNNLNEAKILVGKEINKYSCRKTERKILNSFAFEWERTSSVTCSIISVLDCFIFNIPLTVRSSPCQSSANEMANEKAPQPSGGIHPKKRNTGKVTMAWQIKAKKYPIGLCQSKGNLRYIWKMNDENARNNLHYSTLDWPMHAVLMF